MRKTKEEAAIASLLAVQTFVSSALAASEALVETVRAIDADLQPAGIAPPAAWPAEAPGGAIPLTVPPGAPSCEIRPGPAPDAVETGGRAALTSPAPARAPECAERMFYALQWLLDDLHTAGETHGVDGRIFDSVENAAAALVEAGGHLSWYSLEDARAYRQRPWGA